MFLKPVNASLWVIAIILVSVGKLQPVCAQTNKVPSITKKDNRLIENEARNTLGYFIKLLDNIASVDNTPDDKETFIKRRMDGQDKIFIKATIDEDYRPDMNSPSGIVVKIDDYLNNVKGFYKEDGIKPDGSPGDTISFGVQKTSCVMYDANNRLYIKVYYWEKFNGSYNGAKNYAKNARVVELTAIKVGKEWKTYINSIGFFDPASVGTANCVLVTDDGVDEDAAIVEPMDEKYYSYLLDRGRRRMNNKEWADAFIDFMDASFSNNLKDSARNAMTALEKKMMQSEIIETDKHLYNSIYQKATEYERKHKYELALKCYSYALMKNPTNAGLPNTIQIVKKKVAAQKKLESYLNKGVFSQAVEEYTKAINDDPENADLYIGRARSFAGLKKRKETLSDFNTAISFEKSSVDAYYWKGKYFETKRDAVTSDYDSAYVNFVAASTNVADKADPKLKDLHSEMAFCKGMILFNKQNVNYNQEALDSFAAAYSYNDKNVTANIYKGVCLHLIKKNDEAIKVFQDIIKNDQKGAPEAHYWLGKTWSLYHTSTTDDHLNEAIQEMKFAVESEVGASNGQWNYELGCLLIMKKRAADAIKYFTNCIESYRDMPNNINAVNSLWQRGKCYSLGKDYPKAKIDFEQFKKKNPNPLFYMDYGWLYLKTGDYVNAKECFKNCLPNPETDFVNGLAIYLEAPGSDKGPYMQYFKKAIERGYNPDTDTNIDPNDVLIQKLLTDREFKKLRR